MPVDYLTEKNLKDIVLLGHSYGGRGIPAQPIKTLTGFAA